MKCSRLGTRTRTTIFGVAWAIATASIMFAGQSALSQTSSENPVYKFQGTTDGGYPFAGLIRDGSDNLYGVTTFGGSGGWGVVFKVDPTGHETVLHSFNNTRDGARPMGGLIRDSSGNFYATTRQGAAFGAGTVFKLTSSGTETVLYRFTCGDDGGAPQATLIRDSAGNLYGTTVSGGADGKGLVFKLDPTGKETVLHSFAGYPGDGAKPYAGLVRDASGNFYGTTSGGGSGPCTHGIPPVKVGCGTVFKLAPTGAETILHIFTGGTDGADPFAPVILHNGDLFGTTFIGGAYGNGTVFQLVPSATGWTEHVLHSFLSGSDGQLPESGVIFDAKDNIYGTTSAGGTFGGECPNEGCGFVFELAPTSNGWQEHLLYGFTGGADGGTPYSVVISDTNGNLFGTTFYGGNATCQCGVVFKLTP